MDPLTEPRCGAHMKSDGLPCCKPAMKNGRCRLHGGLSTGPRTAEGLERSRKARWVHGLYSRETVAARREAHPNARAHGLDTGRDIGRPSVKGYAIWLADVAFGGVLVASWLSVASTLLDTALYRCRVGRHYSVAADWSTAP